MSSQAGFSRSLSLSFADYCFPVRGRQVTKILKNLEGRQVIKAVKSVQSKNRKVFMLFDLEPHRDITGGAWWTDQEFDAEFVAVLREAARRIVRDTAKGITVTSLGNKLDKMKVSHVKLRDFEVKEIIDTLVYDKLVWSPEPERPPLRSDDEMAELAASLAPSAKRAKGAGGWRGGNRPEKEFIDDGKLYFGLPDKASTPTENALSRATAILCSPEHNHLVEEYSRAEFPLYEPPLEEGADAMADV